MALNNGARHIAEPHPSNAQKQLHSFVDIVKLGAGQVDLVHPDIRRTLLTMRAFTEGARALAVWIGRNIDIRDHSNSAISKMILPW